MPLDQPRNIFVFLETGHYLSEICPCRKNRSGPGSIPRLGFTWGLNLLVSTLLREYSGFPLSVSKTNQWFDVSEINLISETCSQLAPQR